MIKKLADILFKWFCKPDYYQDIRGDLEENYLEHRRSYSKRMADLLYLREVILLFRPVIARPNLNIFSTNNNGSMLYNYIKTGLRNLLRQKKYTAINVIGLSTGIVSLFFILLFIESETSYDKHHKDGERLFRATTQLTVNGEFTEMATTPPGLARRMISDIPEVESVTRAVGFLGISKNILRLGNESFTEHKGYLVDPDFLEIFDYPLVYGNRTTLLQDPQSIVLSKALYGKMFDGGDPVGEVVTIINDYGTSDYKITGVYDDEGVYSHFNPGFICSMNSGSIGKFVYNNDRIAGNNFLYTYVKLKPDTDVKKCF